MSVHSWLKKIVSSRLLRNPKRRRSDHAITAAACGETLEHRQLLSATNILPVQDISLADDTSTANIVLSDHFDDPDITGSTVRTDSALGSFIVETFDDITPITAQNFVNLAASGNYADMFIHRIDPTDPLSIIQGGGFAYPEGATEPVNVPNNGTIVNEFDNWFDPNLGGLTAGTPLNLRGTLAMAKVANNPDSATSQWFVNLSDNAAILDPQNGGFTVFAQVLYDGMDTVDAIAALQIANAGAPFGELPIQGEIVGGTITRENLVTTTTTVVDELTYSISGNTNASVVNAAIVDGELQVSAVSGQTGTALVTLTVTDLEGNEISEVVEVAVGVPLSTSLKTPTGGGQTTRPTFTWDAVEGATSYEIWVNQVGGQNAIIREQGLTGTSFSATNDLSAGDYLAWIRVSGETGDSIWSGAQSFSINLATVEITSPGTTTAETRPVIEWTAVDGATSYDIWINHVGVQNQFIREDVDANSFTPSTEFEEGTYRVWVRAQTDSAQSEWSAGLTFTVSTSLTITAPETTTTIARPEFRWSGEATETYELWVNAVGGDTRVIHNTAVSGNTFTHSEDLADGLYRAWVRLRPEDGTPGEWSTAYDFTIAASGLPGKPQILDVSGGTQRPRFLWEAVDNGATFELWVNDLTTNTVRIIHQTNLTGVEFTATEDLAVGNYRVWLRAFTSTGAAGAWSDAVDFTI